MFECTEDYCMYTTSTFTEGKKHFQESIIKANSTVQIWPQPMGGGLADIYCRKVGKFPHFFFSLKASLITFLRFT